METERKQKHVFLDPFERLTLAGALIMSRDRICEFNEPSIAKESLMALVCVNRLIEKFDLEEIVEDMEDRCDELMESMDFEDS